MTQRFEFNSKFEFRISNSETNPNSRNLNSFTYNFKVIFWVTIFSIAMAMVESAVVVYPVKRGLPQAIILPGRFFISSTIYRSQYRYSRVSKRNSNYCDVYGCWYNCRKKFSREICLLPFQLRRVGYFLLRVVKSFDQLARIAAELGRVVFDTRYMGRSCFSSGYLFTNDDITCIDHYSSQR